MATSEYNTVEYQKSRMWDALGLAIVCIVGLGLASWFEPNGFMGYIFAFGVIIGTYGFFDHRRYMKKLQKIQVPPDPNAAQVLRTRMAKEFPDISLAGLTDQDLLDIEDEIYASMRAAALGDPRGYAELQQDVRDVEASRMKATAGSTTTTA